MEKKLKMEKKEDLMELVMTSLGVGAKRFQLALRPKDIKYNESKAVIREDLDTYRGFSVGELYIKAGLFYVIAAFVELTAKIENVPRVKRKNVFCVLAIPPSSGGGPPLLPFRRILRATTPDGPIHLFRVEGLKKLKKTKQK